MPINPDESHTARAFRVLTALGAVDHASAATIEAVGKHEAFAGKGGRRAADIALWSLRQDRVVRVTTAGPFGFYIAKNMQPATAATPTIVVGVDPGQSGGLAALDAGGVVLATMRMPVIRLARSELDEAAVLAFLDGLGGAAKIRLVVIEKVHSMPSQSSQSTFTFGYDAGMIRGLARGRDLPVLLVPPQTWMKSVLEGEPKGPRKARPAADAPKAIPLTDKEKTAKRKASKATTLAFVKRLWPSADLRGSTARAAKDHDGIADAVCIAEHGRRLVGK